MAGSPRVHDPGAGLGVRQPQLALVEIDVLPPELQDFSAAAPGQHQKPDGGDRRRRGETLALGVPQRGSEAAV